MSHSAPAAAHSFFRGTGLALGMLVLGQLLPIPGSLPAIALGHFHHPHLATCAWIAGLWFAGACVLGIARARWGADIWQRLPFAAPSRQAVCASAVSLAGLLGLTWAAYAALDRFLPLKAPRHVLEAGPWVIVLGAPVFEELLFRGWGLARLRELGSDRRALVLGALAFALGHAPVQYPATFALGLLLGWIVLRTGSLWPAILGHTAWNGVPVLMERVDLNPGGIVWPLVAALTLAGSALLAFGLRDLKRLPLPGHASETPEPAALETT